MSVLSESVRSTSATQDDDIRSSSSNSSHVETAPLNETSASTELKSLTVPVTCKLCLDEFTNSCDVFSINSCGCSFCKQCMQCYMEVLIRDGVVLSISCPDADCPMDGLLSADEIQSLVQHDTFDKYRRLKFEQEVAIDPNRTFCPQVSCSTVCHVCNHAASHDWTQDPFPVSCPTCQLQFCYICKAEWKPGHKCTSFTINIGNEFQKLQNRAGLSLGESVTIKRCPVCKILIEKDRGCAQMICKNCSHVFCWYCLKLLDNDFMLRHYDKGPCRNMLGHSRAQVLRHRVGVVGLFAAFSLLLVVASPVLLLAAPVILCCKCKECCQQAINQANQHRGSIDINGRYKQNVDLEEIRVVQEMNGTVTSAETRIGDTHTV